MARERTPVVRRYLTRIAVLASLYCAAMFGNAWLFSYYPPNGLIAYGLALIPALPIIGVIWAVMRYVKEEQDEYLRMLFVRRCLFATGFCLSIVTFRDYLRVFELIGPDDHGFGAATIWLIGLGLGAQWNRVTMGNDGGCA